MKQNKGKDTENNSPNDDSSRQVNNDRAEKLKEERSYYGPNDDLENRVDPTNSTGPKEPKKD